MPFKLTNNSGGGGGGDPVVQDSITFFHNASAASQRRVYVALDLALAGLTYFYAISDSNSPNFITSASGKLSIFRSVPVAAATFTVEYEAILPGTARQLFLEVVIQNVPQNANPRLASIVWNTNVDGTFSDSVGRNYYIAPRGSTTNLAPFTAKNDGSGLAGGFDQEVQIQSDFSNSVTLDTTTTGVSNIYFDSSMSRLVHNNGAVAADITVTIAEQDVESLLGGVGKLSIFIDDSTGLLYHNFSFVPVTQFVLLSNTVGYVPIAYNANAASLFEEVYSNGSQFQFVSPTTSNKTVLTSSERQPDYLG